MNPTRGHIVFFFQDTVKKNITNAAQRSRARSRTGRRSARVGRADNLQADLDILLRRGDGPAGHHREQRASGPAARNPAPLVARRGVPFSERSDVRAATRAARFCRTSRPARRGARAAHPRPVRALAGVPRAGHVPARRAQARAGVRTGDIYSEGMKKVSCSEMGDAVVNALKKGS